MAADTDRIEKTSQLEDKMTTDPIRFDSTAFKAQQRALWDAGARGWDTWHDEIETWFAPLTARLLDLAGVRPGHRVLDVGTGYGEPALTVARVVGPRGQVLGVDLSGAMLEVARRRAGSQSNVSFTLADVEALGPQGPFDAVLSRLGLMFVVDRVGTLRAVRRMLRPGGTLAAAVWGPPEFHLVVRALEPLLARLDLPAPPPVAPGPFAMSDPKQTAGELTAAGFVDVSVAEVSAPIRFRSVDEFVRFNLENLPPGLLQGVRDKFGSHDAPDAWQGVRERAQEQVPKDGVLSLPCRALCVRAVAPR
jgi:SAM-dependent methyltransferase